MTQQRFFNFGSPISAASVNAVTSGLTTKGILKGGEITIIQPNIISIAPVWLVFPSGIVLHETENVQLVVPFSSVNKAFTVTYRHTDGGLIGGNAATIQVESGFLSNDSPLLSDGVALAYISYPGGGVVFQQSHVIPAPQATIDSTVTWGDGDFRFPPFSNGFKDGQLSAGTAVVPSVVDTSTAASYSYRVGINGIDLKANASGVLGNNIAFTFVNVTATNQPLQLDVSPDNKLFKILLGKAGGSITSTLSDVINLLNSDTRFSNIATAYPVNNTSVLIPAAFPTGTSLLVPVYQYLSGGFFDLSYQINNTAAGAVDVEHFLRWVFIAGTKNPGSVVMDIIKDSGSTVAFTVTDTNGDVCSLVDTSQPASTRKTARITNGIFTSGRRYFVQATLLTKSNTITNINLFGVSEYTLPF